MAANIYSLLDRRPLLVDECRRWKLSHRVQGHGAIVERLGLSCSLEGHRGCVNCIEWNSDGSLLASGSDDLSIIVWDPYRRKTVATMPTGHTGNIFSVKFAPFSGDTVVLSGAEDREVRLHDLNNFETVKVWSCSPGRVKRLAVSPHSPYLCWSAAEDGCVRQLDTREPHSCSDEGCRNVLIDLKLMCGALGGSTQCKCISINPARPEQIAIGAMDPYVRIYDTRLCSLRRSAKQEVHYGDPSCLAHFAPGHISNPSSKKLKKSINSLATTYLTFSPDGKELLVNLSGDHVYLYDVIHYQERLNYSKALESESADSDSSPTKADAAASCHHGYHPCTTLNGVRRDGGDVLTSTNLRQNQSPPPPPPPVVSRYPTVGERVQKLKEKGLEFHNASKYVDAVSQFSTAISLCPNWHVLYTLRAASLYGRRWEGDMYAALRDAESALALCPTYQKALRRRLRCLQYLNWNKVADQLLKKYAEQYPSDSEFITRTREDLELALKSESESKNGYRSERKPHQSQWEQNRQRNSYDYTARFCGHCNTHTDIKEASFIGERGEYVAAGSDDGNIFIWEKATGNLVRVLKGDDSIVNCIQWHPNVPFVATSGIENVVRLWEPKCPGHEESAEVKDRVKVCLDNQRRMKVDPFEVMLMRMGFHVAMSPEYRSRDVPPRGGSQSRGEGHDEEEGQSQQQQQGGGGGSGGGGGEEEEGGGRGEGQRSRRSQRRRGEARDLEEGDSDEGQVRWIEDPASCRQS